MATSATCVSCVIHSSFCSCQRQRDDAICYLCVLCYPLILLFLTATERRRHLLPVCPVLSTHPPVPTGGRDMAPSATCVSCAIHSSSCSYRRQRDGAICYLCVLCYSLILLFLTATERRRHLLPVCPVLSTHPPVPAGDRETVPYATCVSCAIHSSSCSYRRQRYGAICYLCVLCYPLIRLFPQAAERRRHLLPVYPVLSTHPPVPAGGRETTPSAICVSCVIHSSACSRRRQRDGAISYLCKWRDLPYDQATWETGETDLFEIKRHIENYENLRWVGGAVHWSACLCVGMSVLIAPCDELITV